MSAPPAPRIAPANIAPTCIALSGGVGGAKLALGLTKVMDPDALLIVANTGDDFDHLGLTICPDLDTLTYTLAGLANPETGWGRAEETDTFMRALAALGGETWFHLGDGDLAIHVERSRRLRAGETLSAITADFNTRLGIAPRIVPMSDDPIRTIVDTVDGPLPFQHYFVRDKCEPTVRGFRFDGAETARPNPAFMEALSSATAIIICPSNPFISIDPILALPGVKAALAACPAPIVAISPIVGGRAIKGPTAKMMDELGIPRTAAAIADHYSDLLDGFVLDNADADGAALVQARGLATVVCNTVMENLDDRTALARTVLDFTKTLRKQP